MSSVLSFLGEAAYGMFRPLLAGYIIIAGVTAVLFAISLALAQPSPRRDEVGWGKLHSAILMAVPLAAIGLVVVWFGINLP